jgi:hypothetical protein
MLLNERDAWESFQSIASNSIDILWNNFAKLGRESEVFSPMGSAPGASAWLAESLSLSTNYTTRKLGAMLAGWIIDARYVKLLAAMLDRERKIFLKDEVNANSVGEDIMFSATRWAWCDHAEARAAGIDVLARMVWDALDSTPWNTANWATANLYRATGGKHQMFSARVQAADDPLQDQRLAQNVVRAFREKHQKALDGLVTPPSEVRLLAEDDPHYPMVQSLWRAATAVEKTIRQVNP